MKRDRFPSKGGGLCASHTFADPATALIPKWIHLYNQNVECDFRATLLTLCRVIQNRYTDVRGATRGSDVSTLYEPKIAENFQLNILLSDRC